MFTWVSDPIVRDGLGLKTKPSLERTRMWIVNSVSDPTVRAFAIVCDGEHVGNVILDRIDEAVHLARLSIYIGVPELRSRGIGRAAVSHALRVAFDELYLHKVWLTVHCRNAPAIHSYLRIGFVIEGVLRREFLVGGAIVDCFYMGITRDEFYNIKETASSL